MIRSVNSGSRRAFVVSAGALALSAAFSSAVLAADPVTVLRISSIPDEAPTELQRKFTPVAAYLEKETGLKVSYVPVSDYAAVVEALATGKIDLAWLGGFTFVQAKIRTKGTAKPIVQREEDTKFISRFITTDSTIKTVADVKGKTFAFGSPSSTSGHLMPRYFMLKDGVNPDKDLKNVAFSGNHDATVAFVNSGKVEAGVVNASVWDRIVEQKKIDVSKIRVFATTPPYYDYNWTVRGDLDPKITQKLTDAFLKLDPKNAEHKAVLDIQRASKFVPTSPENYAGIEQAAQSAGLLK